MVYEVISPEAHGNGTIVGMHTESPACIDSLDAQKAMLDAKSKIDFIGTESLLYTSTSPRARLRSRMQC